MKGVEQPSAKTLPEFDQHVEAWEEIDESMRSLSEEMDSMVGCFIGFHLDESPSGQVDAANWTPVLASVQASDRLVISAELPGVEQDHVNVEIRNDRLIIEGERTMAACNEAAARSYDYFYRVMALPDAVQIDAASAILRGGVLEITLPLSHVAKRTRRLKIQFQ